MSKTVWLVANRDGVRIMDHEGDCEDGDTLVYVSTNSSGHVSTRVIGQTNDK